MFTTACCQGGSNLSETRLDASPRHCTTSDQPGHSTGGPPVRRHRRDRLRARRLPHRAAPRTPGRWPTTRGRRHPAGFADDAGTDAGTADDAGTTPVGELSFDDAAAFAALCPGRTTLFFDGPTEVTGRLSNDPAIEPCYLSLGVEFLPFLGSSVLPVILRGQGAQIAMQPHDGLLTNLNTPAAANDVAGRAIRASFTSPVLAVGVLSNVGDGGRLDAFDSLGALIASVPLASGGFAGLRADRPVAHVDVVNTFDADLIFGIYGFQFGDCEP